jgi:RNase P/RNase MRP subunit p29
MIETIKTRYDDDLSHPDRELFEPRKWPIQVHIKLKNRQESDAMSKAIAREFVKRGFRIGTGGWIMKYTGATMKNIARIDNQTSIRVPDEEAVLTLIDPDGKEVMKVEGSMFLELLTEAATNPNNNKEMGEEAARRLEASMRRRMPNIVANNQAPDTATKVAIELVSEIALDRELRINGKKRLVPQEASVWFSNN